MGKKSVVIADNQYLVRYALHHLLSSMSDFAVIGEAIDTEELEKVLAESQVDILLIDYLSADFELEMIEEIRRQFPRLKIVVISPDERKDKILQVLDCGVNAFLTKYCDEGEIIDALRAVLRDDKYFCTRVIDYLLEKSLQGSTRKQNIPLSPREIEVVQLIAKGLVAKEIAALLNLSPHTIYTHRKKIMKKLKLKSATQLVRYAVDAGLLANE
jgi:DNA-binding NarL/FixJ family response regulator